MVDCRPARETSLSLWGFLSKWWPLGAERYDALSTALHRFLSDENFGIPEIQDSSFSYSICWLLGFDHVILLMYCVASVVPDSSRGCHANYTNYTVLNGWIIQYYTVLYWKFSGLRRRYNTYSTVVTYKTRARLRGSVLDRPKSNWDPALASASLSIKLRLNRISHNRITTSTRPVICIFLQLCGFPRLSVRYCPLDETLVLWLSPLLIIPLHTFKEIAHILICYLERR